MNNPHQSAIDQVIQCFFAEFDNRDSRKPDFLNYRSLFVETAMIYKHHGKQIEAMSVDTFITPREAMLTDGTLEHFYEWELEHNTIINGDIATRECRFGKKGRFNGAPYQGEGSKHIQLMNTADGWKIVCVIWQDD